MRRLGIFGIVALAMMILGFLAKRIMIPSAVHYVAYRAPDQPPPGASEQITPADQRQVDEILKRKAK